MRLFVRAIAIATIPASARTEITFSLCVVRNSDRRRKTCSTVRLAVPWNFKRAALGVRELLMSFD